MRRRDKRLNGKGAGWIGAILALGLAGAASGQEFDTRIAMSQRGPATYYVPAAVGGLDPAPFLVDTGAGLTTINEATLEALQARNAATFVRELRGRLANGDILSVPVYRLQGLAIGDDCRIGELEAAVFPGHTRQILGLNALRAAGPFIFSFEPPELVLSHCSGKRIAAGGPEDPPGRPGS